MNDILPPRVLLRETKGVGLTGVIVRTLRKNVKLIYGLIDAPILADYGVIDSRRLRQYVTKALVSERADPRFVARFLHLESWMRSWISCS